MYKTSIEKQTATNSKCLIVKIAANEIGYEPTENGYTKYGEYTGYPYGAWCQSFVAWCANEACIPTSIIEKYASCTLEALWFKGNANWYDSEYYSGDYIPQEGDLIFFRWGVGYEKIDHVGLVESVSNNVVNTIEGNSGGKVKRKSYYLSDSCIVGYGIPNYNQV